MRMFMGLVSISSILAGAWLVATPAGAATIQVVNVDAKDGTNGATCGGPDTPCLTLGFARTRVNPGGTLLLREPGNYGGGGIFTQGVNIRGVLGAGIFSPPGAPCLTFNGGPNDVLTVRDVVCDQDGAAQDGFLFNSGHKGRFDNVVIRGITGAKCGVRFKPSAGNDEVMINNVTITENGTTGTNDGGGICVLPTGTANVFGAIRNSVFQNNRHGFVSSASGSATSNFLIENTDVSGNVGGIFSVGANSNVCIRNSTIANNSFMSLGGTGNVLTAGNNLVWNNVGGDPFDGTCP